jgi:hypothetical protein
MSFQHFPEIGDFCFAIKKIIASHYIAGHVAHGSEPLSENSATEL